VPKTRFFSRMVQIERVLHVVALAISAFFALLGIISLIIACYNLLRFGAIVCSYLRNSRHDTDS
jgi:hypothetical protein